MSSISIKVATSVYGGATEAETLQNMAREVGCYRIYRYCNGFGGNKTTPTDYKQIMRQSDEQELLSRSSCALDPVLVHDRGTVLSVSTQEEAKQQTFEAYLGNCPKFSREDPAQTLVEDSATPNWKRTSKNRTV
jgi:hypothetical protein